MSKNRNLKLYLKTDGSYDCLYKITVTKNLIIINITPQLTVRFINNYLGDNFFKDVHFTYPKDGNYHHSFKNQDKGSEKYITGYHLKTTKKYDCSSNGCKKNKKNGLDIFNMFVPERVYSFEELRGGKFFQFPGFCMGHAGFKMHFLGRGNISGSIEDNIVIDSLDLKNKCLNVYGFLIGENYNWEKLLPNSKDVEFYYKDLVFNGLRVLLFVRID